MIERDYLIVGAGAAGAAVAQALRQYDAKGTVAMVGNEAFPPYHRQRMLETILSGGKPAPKENREKKNGATATGSAVAKAAKELEAISCFPPGWYSENLIDLRLDTLITQFNIERRLAVLNDGQVIRFRKACLAMGSRPVRPRVAGAHLGHIIPARTLRDILALREIAPTVKNIVVIGGGFVATEAASALRRLGCTVAIMSRHRHLWHNRLDAETAAWLTGYFQSHEIPVFQESLNGFEGKTVLQNIQTKSGRSIPAGVALLALGTELNLGLVMKTPLVTADGTGTPVNDHFETDEKGIYAVGDIALYPDSHFGGTRRSPFPETTLQQAAVAGANITGKKRQRFKGLPHHRTRALDLQFDFVGDFGNAPVRFEIDGEHAQRQFTARYFRGNKPVGILLCNQPDEAIEAAKAALANG